MTVFEIPLMILPVQLHRIVELLIGIERKTVAQASWLFRRSCVRRESYRYDFIVRITRHYVNDHSDGLTAVCGFRKFLNNVR